MIESATTEACWRCGQRADEAGWCGVCGADLVPDAKYTRFSRYAKEREARWLADPDAVGREYEATKSRDDALAPPPPPPPAPVEKTCPDCAETVKAAANVCRFCGHRFDQKRYGQPRPGTPAAAGAYPQQVYVQRKGVSAIVPVGYVMAVFIPLVGFILGIVAATRTDEPDTRAHGPYVIALSVVAFFLWLAIVNSGT